VQFQRNSNAVVFIMVLEALLVKANLATRRSPTINAVCSQRKGGSAEVGAGNLGVALSVLTFVLQPIMVGVGGCGCGQSCGGRPAMLMTSW